MSMRSILLSVLALVVASTACRPAGGEAGPLSEEDLEAIRAIPRSYTEATLANDYAALGAHWAEHAVNMVPNQSLIRGRAAIQARYEAVMGMVTEYSNAMVEIEGRGDLAYARGVISIAFTPKGMPEPVRDTIKYLAVVRKQPDGSWLFTHVCWNSDLPIPEEGSETGT